MRNPICRFFRQSFPYEKFYFSSASISTLNPANGETYANRWTSISCWTTARIISLLRSALSIKGTCYIVTIIALSHMNCLHVQMPCASIIFQMTCRSKRNEKLISRKAEISLQYWRVSDAVASTDDVLSGVDAWTFVALTLDLSIRFFYASTERAAKCIARRWT